MSSAITPSATPSDQKLAGSGGRVFATVLVAAALVAAVGWLIADLNPVQFTRAARAPKAVATARISQCADVPTDAPGAGPGFTAAAADVTLNNPTSDELRALVVVDFGDLGLGDSRAVRVKAHSTATIRVAPPVARRVGGFDCTLVEATFAKP